MAEMPKEVTVVTVEGDKTDEEYDSEVDETYADYCFDDETYNDNDSAVYDEEEETYIGCYVEEEIYSDVEKGTFADYDINDEHYSIDDAYETLDVKPTLTDQDIDTDEREYDTEEENGNEEEYFDGFHSGYSSGNLLNGDESEIVDTEKDISDDECCTHEDDTFIIFDEEDRGDEEDRDTEEYAYYDVENDDCDIDSEQYDADDVYKARAMGVKLADLNGYFEESEVSDVEYDTEEESINEEEYDINQSKMIPRFENGFYAEYFSEKLLNVEESEVVGTAYDTEEEGITDDECYPEEDEYFIDYGEEERTYDKHNTENDTYSEFDEEESLSEFVSIQEIDTDHETCEYELEEDDTNSNAYDYDVKGLIGEYLVKGIDICELGANQTATHIKKNTDETITSNENLKLHLICLLESLVKKLVQDFDLCEKAIREATDDMNDTFRQVPSGKYSMDMIYGDMNYCVGYLHRFAPCHAAMVQDAILKVLESPPPEVTSKFTSKQYLNIVCLGSGPGNDLFGFLSAFHRQCMKLKGIDITVVDKMVGWKEVFDNTIHLLKKESHGDLSRLFTEGPNISTSYIQSDLENYVLCSDLRVKLEKADVILLVKVLSHIPDENRLRVLKNIEICMQPGSLLFFIDCPMHAEEFAALSSLSSVYKTRVNLYKFHHRCKKFGHKNLIACHTSTRILVKQN